MLHAFVFGDQVGGTHFFLNTVAVVMMNLGFDKGVGRSSSCGAGGNH